MKNLIILLSVIFFTATLQAQPDIKKSLYVKSKKCFPVGKSQAFMYSAYNNIYGISYLFNYKSPTSYYDTKITKYDSNFDTIWTKVIGGGEEDRMMFLNELPDGKILLTGQTSSTDMDVLYGHAWSAQEIWFAIIDTNGNILNGKTVGGGNGSDLTDVKVSKNGKYVYACGNTLANDYDFFHTNWGPLDADGFVMKLDTALNLYWIKYVSGEDNDGANTTVCELSNEKIAIACGTASLLGNTLGVLSKGLNDIYVAVLDTAGNTVFAKRYGGSKEEATQRMHYDTINKKIYIMGTTWSWDKDLSWNSSAIAGTLDTLDNRFGASVMIIDTSCNLLNYKAYGTSGVNKNDMLPTDALFYNNEYWVFGYTNGMGGDVDSPIYSYCAWIGVIDSNANLIAKYTIDGNYEESAYNLFQFQNKIFALGGSQINLGETAPNTFSCDSLKTFGYLLEFGEAPLGIKNVEKGVNVYKIRPNPADNILYIDFNKMLLNEKIEIIIANIEGKTIFREKIRSLSDLSKQIDLSMLERGNYILNIRYKSNTYPAKFQKL